MKRWEVSGCDLDVYEDEDGPFVHYEDYEDLTARAEKAEAELREAVTVQEDLAGQIADLTRDLQRVEAERDEAVSAVRGARRYTEEMAHRIPDLGDDEDYREAVSRVVRERDEAMAKIAAAGVILTSHDSPLDKLEILGAALSDVPPRWRWP